MLPDRVSNPGPLTYESGTLPIALRGPALGIVIWRISYGFRRVRALVLNLKNGFRPLFCERIDEFGSYFAYILTSA